jgi:hypothetical protein
MPVTIPSWRGARLWDRAVGVMYAFLLLLGAVIAAAGVLIAAPGLPFDGREFDASIITPGAVAVVGGLILIGLGLAVRVLTRIERALAARPQPVVLAEATDALAPVPTRQAEPPQAAPETRIPFPPKPEVRPKPAPAAATQTLPEDAALERLREQFPTLARLESAPGVEEADVSLLPKPPARVDEEVAENNGTAAQVAANDAAPAKAEPRIELPLRAASRPERSRSFDAFWPKKPRPAPRNGQAMPAIQPEPDVQPAVTLQLVEPALAAEPTQFQFREPAPEPQLTVVPEPPTPVSILKSGVVDGMAYTLYSDGSIEAQLPQGTLRFGSIAELRNHIEQSA